MTLSSSHLNLIVKGLHCICLVKITTKVCIKNKGLTAVEVCLVGLGYKWQFWIPSIVKRTFDENLDVLLLFNDAKKCNGCASRQAKYGFFVHILLPRRNYNSIFKMFVKGAKKKFRNYFLS